MSLMLRSFKFFRAPLSILSQKQTSFKMKAIFKLTDIRYPLQFRSVKIDIAEMHTYTLSLCATDT